MTDDESQDATSHGTASNDERMKRAHALFALATMAVAGTASAAEIRATVDGNYVDFPNAQPTMVNDRVLVPVRGVFEHMGATVDWDESTRKVTARHGSDVIVMTLDQWSAMINDRQVQLEAPARMMEGSTMVPLRFLGESMGAAVNWNSASRTVEIMTKEWTRTGSNHSMNMRARSGTVMPLTTNMKLSSDRSRVGDRFTATLDTGQETNYQGLPSGTVFEGHVDAVKAKSGDTPGVLGLTFDRVRLPDGQSHKVSGSLIGLDDKSVVNEDGRLVAKPGAKTTDLKYVGYGAGAGALVAIVTKGNVLTTSVIGAAIGYLFGETQKDNSAHDVTLDSGSKVGFMLDRELAFRSPTDRS